MKAILCQKKVVGQTIEDIYRVTKGGIIVATFASNIHHVQQIFDTACKFNEKVAVVGRSMVNVIQILHWSLDIFPYQKGYLFMELDEISKLPKGKVVMITSGVIKVRPHVGFDKNS